MLAQLILLYLATRALAADRFSRPGFHQRYSGSPGYAAAPGRTVKADDVYPSTPFSFSYDTVDEYGTKLFHREKSDAANARTGSYGYTDTNGIYRRVSYVADANGFRATIETNEPGTQAGASADAVFNAKPVAAGPRFGARGRFALATDSRRRDTFGYGPTQHSLSGSGRHVYNQAASGRPGYKQGGYEKAGYGQAGNVQAEHVRTGYKQSGNAPTGYGKTGYGQGGLGQSRYRAYRSAHLKESHNNFAHQS